MDFLASSAFIFDFLGFVMPVVVSTVDLDFLALGFAPVVALFFFMISAMVEVWVGDGERRENL